MNRKIAWLLLLFPVLFLAIVFTHSKELPLALAVSTSVVFLIFSLVVLITIFYLIDLIEKKRVSYYLDPLTHLPNRNQLLIDIEEKKINSLMLLNADNFRELNNFYGNLIGDKLLFKLGEKLCFLQSDLEYQLYKMSADEFAFGYNSKVSLSQIENRVKFLHKIIENTMINVDEWNISLNITCGIASNCDELLEKADLALGYAKQKFKSFTTYQPNLGFQANYGRNLSLLTQLRDAVSNGNLIPFYQPIVEIATGKVVKFESLARLISDQQELIAPDLFLPIAKSGRFLSYITRAIIKQTFSVFSDSPYEFSVNLEISDIENPVTMKLLFQYMEKYNCAHRVVFEITERENLEYFETLLAFIKKVKGLGAKVAIDDFGSGYSNYRNIIELGFDYLKIDGSIIKDIDSNTTSRILVENISSFCRSLGIKTIAEYVHKKEIHEIIKSIGIDYGQGFYYSKPVPTPHHIEKLVYENIKAQS